MNNLIETYKSNLHLFNDKCKNINTETEYKDLFRGIFVMFLEDFVKLYNKLSIKINELNTNKIKEKIDNLNKLLDILNNDGKIFGIDCNEIILRGYINYFYTSYREKFMLWDLNSINTNENSIKNEVLSIANNENALEITSNYLDIIPEVVIMFENIKDKDKLKFIYILNNLNTVLDVYLAKKSLKLI
jgi:hypothetical protein